MKRALERFEKKDKSLTEKIPAFDTRSRDFWHFKRLREVCEIYTLFPERAPLAQY